jgi:two-component system response regulator YesN
MPDDTSLGERLADLVLTKSIAATDGERLHPQVSRVLRHIHRHYAEPTMTLVTAAQAVGCSPYYLSRLLKRQTKRTFLEHLTDYRLVRASHVLTHSGCSIKEIAALTGFSSSDHFARACKRHFGLGPAKIRRARGTQFLTPLRQDLTSD